MIHYGKNLDGELEIRVSEEDVAELWSAIDHAVLPQRRTFHGLKDYIEKQFGDELARARSQQKTAQMTKTTPHYPCP